MLKGGIILKKIGGPKLKKLIILAIVALVGTNAVASGEKYYTGEAPEHTFYKEKGQGWFWYEEYPEEKPLEEPKKEDPKKKEPKKEEPKKKEPKKKEPKNEFEKKIEIKINAEEKKEKPLSVQWLKENLPKYLEQAQDNPTRENVEVYMMLQRIAFDKAERFAITASNIAKTDPILGEHNEMPDSMAGRKLRSKAASANLKTVSEKLFKDTVGLWFFFESDCKFCQNHAANMEFMTKRYGAKVKAISVDGKGLPQTKYSEDFSVDSGQARRLGIEVYPSVYVVNVKNGEIAYLSVGFTSISEMQERLVLISKERGWLTQKDFESTKERPHNWMDRNVSAEDMTGDDMKDVREILSDKFKIGRKK